MRDILLSLLTGTIAGFAFGFLKLPIPAPTAIAGIAGIIGIFVGYLLSSKV